MVYAHPRRSLAHRLRDALFSEESGYATPKLGGRLQREGATREGIVEAARDDYRALLVEHASPPGLESEALRSRSAC